MEEICRIQPQKIEEVKLPITNKTTISLIVLKEE